MYSNFGPIVQVKHITLDQSIAENITHTVTSGNIIIVCRKAEAPVIQTILQQIGWSKRIQSIVTFEQLYKWYDMALKGEYSPTLAAPLKHTLENEIKSEFPIIGSYKFKKFIKKRGYHNIELSLFT